VEVTPATRRSTTLEDENPYTDTLRLLGLAIDRNEAETKRLERIARGSPLAAPLSALREAIGASHLQREALLRAVRDIDAVKGA